MAECRALAALAVLSRPDRREFVGLEVGCLLHVSPQTGGNRLEQALAVTGLPRLVDGLEHGLIAVPHALALLSEVAHLPAPHAAAVVAAVLDGPVDPDGVLDQTPSQLRSSARRAAITLDPDAARKRHEQAKQDLRGAGCGRSPTGWPTWSWDAPRCRARRCSRPCGAGRRR